MTKFPEGNDLSYGDILGPAMNITDANDAHQYFREYVQYIQNWMDSEKPRKPQKDTAEQIAKANLGYYAGYYDNKTRQRVEKLFCCEHPIFGSIKENGVPTGKEAWECGNTGKTLKEIRK